MVEWSVGVGGIRAQMMANDANLGPEWAELGCFARQLGLYSVGSGELWRGF